MKASLKTFLITLVILPVVIYGILGYLEWNSVTGMPTGEMQPAEALVIEKSEAESKEPVPLVEEIESEKANEMKNISDRAPTDYVDIRDIDENIIVRPIFLEMPLMTGKGSASEYKIVQTYEKAVLRKATAEKLSDANSLAMEKYGCCIRVYEAYRAVEVQTALREHFVNTAPVELQSKVSSYIASPGFSKHQIGVAVDLTLVDLETGEELKMPSAYLSFSPDASAYPDSSVNDEETVKNVKKLQDVMVASGFDIYNREWWHFNDTVTAKGVKYENISPDDY